MSGVRLTAELRELERTNVVSEMHANPGGCPTIRRRPPAVLGLR
jgi:hypothetical protein